MSVPPPLSAGGLKETVKVPAPTVAETIVGFPGALFGLAVPVNVALAAPVPTEFTARTRTSYVVPLTRDETVISRDVLPVDFHVEPPSSEY